MLVDPFGIIDCQSCDGGNKVKILEKFQPEVKYQLRILMDNYQVFVMAESMFEFRQTKFQQCFSEIAACAISDARQVLDVFETKSSYTSEKLSIETL